MISKYGIVQPFYLTINEQWIRSMLEQQEGCIPPAYPDRTCFNCHHQISLLWRSGVLKWTCLNRSPGDGHQMLLGRSHGQGSQVWCPGEGWHLWDPVQWGQYIMGNDHRGHPLPRGQTGTNENITFPRLIPHTAAIHILLTIGYLLLLWWKLKPWLPENEIKTPQCSPFFQPKEVGPLGVYGLDVQSVVEAEPCPDPDLVPIHHLNMEETTVSDHPLKILDVTITHVPVSISRNGVLFCSLNLPFRFRFRCIRKHFYLLLTKI